MSAESDGTGSEPAPATANTTFRKRFDAFASEIAIRERSNPRTSRAPDSAISRLQVPSPHAQSITSRPLACFAANSYRAKCSFLVHGGRRTVLETRSFSTLNQRVTEHRRVPDRSGWAGTRSGCCPCHPSSPPLSPRPESKSLPSRRREATVRWPIGSYLACSCTSCVNSRRRRTSDPAPAGAGLYRRRGDGRPSPTPLMGCWRGSSRPNNVSPQANEHAPGLSPVMRRNRAASESAWARRVAGNAGFHRRRRAEPVARGF
jgi:hypothetical protein